MVEIYTSYFAKVKHLPANIVPVSISLRTPYWLPNIVRYPPLFPKTDMLDDIKAGGDQELYRIRYIREILYFLNLYTVLYEIQSLSPDSYKFCLLCYERSTDFCHRHIVRDYMNGMLGDIITPIAEYTFS